jgi:hypothetical protein
MTIQLQNRAHFPNSQAQRRLVRALHRGCLLLFVLSLSVGCVRLPSATPDVSPKQPTESSKPKEATAVLGAQREKKPEPSSALPKDKDSQGEPIKAQSSPDASSAQVKKSKPQDEDHEVKAAARELSKSIGSIEKIKVCYVTKDDEWWAIFYEDIGPVIDVKQFIWNRELEKFEPFLVLKRISKAKLAEELKQDQSGHRCDILAPPEKPKPEKPKPEKPK